MNASIRALTVKVGHGYHQLYDFKAVCYRCFFSGRHKKSLKRACAHSQTPLTTITTVTAASLRSKSCWFSSVYIELLLVFLMITTVMGIGNFSKHFKVVFILIFCSCKKKKSF